MITQEALHDLLCDLFVDAGQLQRFIRHGEQGEAILRELPGAAVSLAERVDRAVGELFRRGLVAGALERLRTELPLRCADINRVANSMPRAASSATSTSTGFPTAASVPLSRRRTRPAGSDAAADRLAILYTVLQSAVAHGHEPWSCRIAGLRPRPRLTSRRGSA